MWKSLFFLGNPGRKREKPLWNGCGGRVERKAAPCSFTHPRGNPAVECGKKVEKITKKDIEYLYKKSMKNPVNKRFLEEFYQQEEQAEEQKTETKKGQETEEISI